jgi:hypothetical protein
MVSTSLHSGYFLRFAEICDLARLQLIFGLPMAQLTMLTKAEGIEVAVDCLNERVARTCFHCFNLHAFNFAVVFSSQLLVLAVHRIFQFF